MISFTHGRVFLGTGEADFAEAFTIDGDRFTWVGSAADAPADAVDLGGATVLPGLLDVHMHPGLLAELVDAADLLPPGVTSTDDMLDRLRAHPLLGRGPDAWVEGFGYNETRYADPGPTCRDLDRVSTTQPVFARRADVHTGVVNTYLLDRAGITASTPDPPGARFGRFPDGTPNGVLYEFGALDAALRLRPAPTEDDWVNRLVRLNERFMRLGLTTVDDMLASVVPNCLAVFRRAADAGYRPRTGLFLLWPPEGLPDLTDADRTGRVRIAGVKLLLDGAYSNRTAWTVDPYPGSCDHGIPTTTPKAMRDAVAWARRNGVQAALHAMGDAAINQILDEFADDEPWLGEKPSITIQHSTLFSPAMIDRVAAARMTFGVVSHTIFFFAEYPDYEANLSAGQFAMAYPIKDFYERLPCTALASDSPATAWSDCENVFYSVKAAVTRRAFNGADLNQAQAITVGQALELYTGRAARVTTASDVGTIEGGREASFVIVDADPFGLAPERLDQVGVRETWVAGERAWRRPDAEGPSPRG